MQTTPIVLAGLLAATLLLVPAASATAVATEPVAPGGTHIAAYYACLAAGINPAICKQILDDALRACQIFAHPWYDICVAEA